MKRRKHKRIVNIFQRLFSRRVDDPDNEDWRLELNQMVIGKDKIDSCPYCGIIFEKQGDTCPGCHRALNHNFFQ